MAALIQILIAATATQDPYRLRGFRQQCIKSSSLQEAMHRILIAVTLTLTQATLAMATEKSKASKSKASSHSSHGPL